ncbi:MAG: hypothetical protein KDC66_17715 [Phaeodactylibacter sp.]|nr:hypothetical protein [Phaeodactylibacter sp.]MCB9273574.1 hypothetical protein [Lewinellaceae bacterium]
MIEEQILQTWRIHQHDMILLIESIPDDAFGATLSTRGGRDIARQLAHVHMVRAARLSSFAKKQGAPLIEFDKAESPGREKLLEAFRQSGGLMEVYMQDSLAKGGAVSNFRNGLVPMLGYYISHEAHHRGNILLTMKQSGFRIPDALRWLPGEWWVKGEL